MPGQNDAKSFEEGAYGKESAADGEESKAKQSQFSAPTSLNGAGKRQKSLAAANSLTG